MTSFVATNIILSFVVTNFDMTKKILVAALTNDRGKGSIVWVGEGGR